MLDDAGAVHSYPQAFRLDGTTPLPGDMVRFSTQKDSYGFIEEILPRRNEMKRPRVANVDMVAIVVSAQKPQADKLLCDKLIVHLKQAGIRPLLVINKCDVAAPEAVDALEAEYRGICPVVRVSAMSGEGLSELKAALSGCCTCFAGQSAVGKSSLLNALFSHLSLETGACPGRWTGRHHAELIVRTTFRHGGGYAGVFLLGAGEHWWRNWAPCTAIL